MAFYVVQATAVNSLPRQTAVYQKYLLLQTLAARRPGASLAGALVLTSGMGREGMELAMASTIAGAAFLGTEPRPQRLKSALHQNACDFMVNTLDEALRVLKNAVRKGQPVAVGLLGNAAELLPQMVERGVQPEFLSDTSPLDAPEEYIVPASLRTADGGADVASCRTVQLSALAQMVERGAVLAAPSATLRTALSPSERNGATAAPPSIRPAPRPLDAVRATQSQVRWNASGFQDMRRMDALVSSLLPATDGVRLRWLERAAGCFHRQTPLERAFSLLPEELVALLAAIQKSSFRETLEDTVVLHWQDATGEEQTLQLLSGAPARNP